MHPQLQTLIDQIEENFDIDVTDLSGNLFEHEVQIDIDEAFIIKAVVDDGDIDIEINTIDEDGDIHDVEVFESITEALDYLADFI